MRVAFGHVMFTLPKNESVTYLIAFYCTAMMRSGNSNIVVLPSPILKYCVPKDTSIYNWVIGRINIHSDIMNNTRAHFRFPIQM